MLNAEELLNQSTDGAMSTQVTPIPEGDYQAVIQDVEGKTINTKDGERLVLSCKFELQDNDGSIQEATGREGPHERTENIFLDLTGDGNLDLSKGKNVRLGRLREAVGQNEGGKPWRPADLVGQPLTVTIKHSASDDGERIFENIRGFARPA